MNREEAFAELGRGVYAALETYSNVHRGSGINSMISTSLYEKAREIVLEYLKLNSRRYVVIFCSPRRVELFRHELGKRSLQVLSSDDIGLSLGVRALAVRKNELPAGAPSLSGGGTTRLVSHDWVLWAGAPDRFEAGTPAIINIIAFAKALKMIMHYNQQIFLSPPDKKVSAAEILNHDEFHDFTGHQLLDALRKSQIGFSFQVPAANGFCRYINLDNAASTPAFAPVWNAVFRTWMQDKSVHDEIIRESINVCSRVLGAPSSSYDFIFTCNTTEAVNITAEYFSSQTFRDVEPVVLTTWFEHTSNDLPWRSIPGVSITRINFDSRGFIDLNNLETVLNEYNVACNHGRQRIVLFSMTGASNVLALFNNLQEISSIVHKYGAKLFVDGAQMVAHRRIEIQKWDVDYFAFSAHKVYAPFGCGVLVSGKGLIDTGSGRMKRIIESGEENAGGIAGLAKSLLLLERIGMEFIMEEERRLTARLLSGLSEIPGITVYGVREEASRGFEKKGGVVVFLVSGLLSPRIARELSELGGIGVRSGCHCAHILVKRLVGVPPGLERFQKVIAILFPWLRFPGLVRVSLGLENTEEDIERFLRVLKIISIKENSRKQWKTRQQINDFVSTAVERVYTL